MTAGPWGAPSSKVLPEVCFGTALATAVAFVWLAHSPAITEVSLAFRHGSPSVRPPPLFPSRPLPQALPPAHPRPVRRPISPARLPVSAWPGDRHAPFPLRVRLRSEFVSGQSVSFSVTLAVWGSLVAAVVLALWRWESRAAPLIRDPRDWVMTSSTGYTPKYRPEELQKLRVAELKGIASEHSVSIADCFTRDDIVAKLLTIPDKSFDPKGAIREPKNSDTEAASAPSTPTATPTVTASDRLAERPTRELRSMIAEAGLSSVGLIERNDLLRVATEAQGILDKRPKFPDADKYRELKVEFYGRPSCPYCVKAMVAMQRRGLYKLGWRDPEVKNVEVTEYSTRGAFDGMGASQEMERRGGRGVPFFYSSRTRKSVSGWQEGHLDLTWLLNRLQ